MLRAGRLSVGVSGVRSPPVMLLLVSPFMSFIVFLTHLGAPMFGAYIIVVSSFWRARYQAGAVGKGRGWERRNYKQHF